MYSRNMEEQIVVKALAALAQPFRLQIFRALIVAGGVACNSGLRAAAAKER